MGIGAFRGEARGRAGGGDGEASGGVAGRGLATGRRDEGVARSTRHRTIGQVLELPRRDLALRFDVELLRRLDQALGQTAEVIQPHPLKPEIEASFSFEYAVDHLPTLKVVLERLAGQVEGVLRQRHVGTRQVECSLRFAGSEPCRFEIGLFRPTQSAAHLCKMLLGRLEQVRLEEPVCGMSLRVPSTEPIPENQGDFLEPAADWEALARLLDQLSNSLGQDEVMHAELVADYQPEYACRYQPVMQRGRKTRGSEDECGKGDPDCRRSASPEAGEAMAFSRAGAGVGDVAGRGAGTFSLGEPGFRGGVLVGAGADRNRLVERTGRAARLLRADDPSRQPLLDVSASGGGMVFAWVV